MVVLTAVAGAAGAYAGADAGLCACEFWTIALTARAVITTYMILLVVMLPRLHLDVLQINIFAEDYAVTCLGLLEIWDSRPVLEEVQVPSFSGCFARSVTPAELQMDQGTSGHGKLAMLAKVPVEGKIGIWWLSISIEILRLTGLLIVT